MSQTSMQKVYQLLIFGILIGLSVSRPNGNVESQVISSIIILLFGIALSFSLFFLDFVQESSDNQLTSSDVEKTIPYYRPLPSMQYYTFDEPGALDRYRMQPSRSFYQTSPFRSGGSIGGGAANFPVWDPLQQLVSKRQTRYRQCYFNPISCFRK